MAHTQGTSTRVQRLTSLVAICLVAVAVGLAFGRVYQGKATTLTLVGAGLASGALAWILERRSLLLATVASAAALVFAVTVLVFPETTWYGLPTLDSFRHIGAAAAQVGEEARLRVSPTEPVDPLLLAGVVASWAAVFSCHALAFRAGSPLLALVPPVALVAFADSVLEEFVKPVYGVMFLVAALAVVFADALRRMQGWGPIWTGPGRANRLLPSNGRGARRIAASAVVVAVLAPFVVPGFGAQAVIDVSSINQDDRIRVSPLVSVAAQLKGSDPVDVFEVTTPQHGYWRMTALERFDGIEWTPADEETRPVASGEGLAEEQDRTVEASFTILNDLGYEWLPVGTHPASVTVDEPLTWAPGTETLTTDGPLDAGAVYEAVSTYPQPTAAELREDRFPSADFFPELVQLPDDLPPEIQALAEDWTADAETTYDTIVAIERRFNDITQFRYSLDVSPREDSESLVEFLTVTREGFCQQFAAAMAVMLRTLGIPARIAVGYTQGTIVGGSDTHRIGTEDLHAWVEVRFPTYGWLPFEPTPGRDNPLEATYAPRTPGGPDGSPEETCIRPNPRNPNCAPRDPGATRPTPSVAPRPTPPDAVGGDGGLRLAWPAVAALAVGGLALVLGLALPAWRAFRRRRRLRRAADHPRRLILATYDVFAERAGELGLGRGVGETPREYAGRIQEDGRLANGEVSRLTTLTTRAAYAPQEPSRDDALDAVADARVAVEQLRKATPLGRRLRGRFVRPST